MVAFFSLDGIGAVTGRWTLVCVGTGLFVLFREKDKPDPAQENATPP